LTELSLTPTESVLVRSATPEALEVEATYAPGGSAPPPHLHPAQDERFEVLAGEVHVKLAGQERTLRTGDVLEIPRETAHQMWNPGAEPARVSWTTTPAGRTLDWFGALDAKQRAGAVGRNGMPGPLALAALLDEYDDVFRLAVGPRRLVGAGISVLARLGRLRAR
jgi:quercetin dioxygenase-like cupin family protein